MSTIAGLTSTPEKELAKGLPDVAGKDRKLISEQLFKVIGLKDDRFDRLQLSEQYRQIMAGQAGVQALCNEAERLVDKYRLRTGVLR